MLPKRPGYHRHHKIPKHMGQERKHVMLKYLKNSEISFRIGLNPFNWKWIPKLAYDPPSPFYPKRRTYALVWLFLQAFLDVDDGTSDQTSFAEIFNRVMDRYKEEDDEREVGQKVSKTRTGDSILEQGPEY